jgi:hypothetical protein
MKKRRLKQAEIDLAWQVFRNTLPYERIRVCDDLGFFDCPWTEIVDAPGWGTGDHYYLHMGSIGYLNLISTDVMLHDNDYVKNTFIHELTHVWQAYHENKWVFTRSAAQQICAVVTSDDIYAYEPGLEWDSYNVEQQAKIVEHWFTGAIGIVDGKTKYTKPMAQSGARYDYIRDHIRNR